MSFKPGQLVKLTYKDDLLFMIIERCNDLNTNKKAYKLLSCKKDEIFLCYEYESYFCNL